MCELYPARIRAMGMGVISSFGTLATTLNPIYLGFFRRNGLNVFTVFLILGIIAIGCLTLLPETKGRKMIEEIAEIES
jgi:MFS family permease